jgi:hypothetical protein
VKTEPKKFPLFFSYRDLIAGSGFVAGVAMKGRVLLDMTGEEVWMYGVQPGGIAGGGLDRACAFNEFRRSYLSVLYDLAAEAKSFKGFNIEVTRFFSEMNGPNADDWTAALTAVRKSGTSLEGLTKVNADAERCALEVVSLTGVRSASPQLNQLDPVINEAA